MRSRHKPDLLFILTVFVGLGIVVSSYIQHSRANPTLTQAKAPTAKQQVKHPIEQDNPLVLVSNPVHTDTQNHADKGVLVINSPNQP